MANTIEHLCSNNYSWVGSLLKDPAKRGVIISSTEDLLNRNRKWYYSASPTMKRGCDTCARVSGKDIVGDAVMTSGEPHSAGFRSDKESGQ